MEVEPAISLILGKNQQWGASMDPGSENPGYGASVRSRDVSPVWPAPRGERSQTRVSARSKAFNALVDQTGERNAKSRIALGVSDLRELRKLR